MTVIDCIHTYALLLILVVLNLVDCNSKFPSDWISFVGWNQFMQQLCMGSDELYFTIKLFIVCFPLLLEAPRPWSYHTSHYGSDYWPVMWLDHLECILTCTSILETSVCFICCFPTLAWEWRAMCITAVINNPSIDSLFLYIHFFSFFVCHFIFLKEIANESLHWSLEFHQSSLFWVSIKSAPHWH